MEINEALGLLIMDRIRGYNRVYNLTKEELKRFTLSNTADNLWRLEQCYKDLIDRYTILQSLGKNGVELSKFMRVDHDALIHNCQLASMEFSQDASI